MIHYKCACGESYQSDELAAGEQVRCRACGSVLTVPGEATGTLDRRSGEPQEPSVTITFH